MQLFARLKKILFMGFRATLNLTSEANSSHSPLFFDREHGKGNFRNFENLYKIKENS